MISRFLREIDWNSALLGYYAASGGNLLPTFRDNISVPSSGVKNPKSFFSRNVGKKKYHSSLRSNPEEDSSQLNTMFKTQIQFDIVHSIPLTLLVLIALKLGRSMSQCRNIFYVYNVSVELTGLNYILLFNMVCCK